MTDFTEGFATGFEVVALIKEKQKAKKAMQEVQNTLQEWQLSGKEPSYVDKLMLGLTVTKVGENYSKIYNDITNSKDSYDKEKMSQSAINLREYNDQVLNFVKMIQTSAKEGTLDLIPWDSVQALMPDVDLTKVLSSIPELKNKQYEAKTKEQNIDIYGKTPESIRQAVGEQAGLIPTGLEPTTAPKAPGISDYKGAVDYLKNFSKITTPPDTFNRVKAGLQNKFPDIDLSDITQESLREPEAVAGVEKPKAIPAPTSIENIREDIRNADTPEDARRIYNNGVQQYGEEAFTKAVGITEVDKFWAEGQIPYLDKIKTSIGNIIDEKGWLKKGTLTSAEVGVDFEGDQKVEEIYEMLRKEYMKYFDMLTKMGLPLLEFPILKPLEEIEKVGLGEGFWGWGKQRGQYKSIYK